MDKKEDRNKVILELRKNGWTQMKVAKHYGISDSRVCRITGSMGRTKKIKQPRKRPTPIERLYRLTIRSTPDNCWEWGGCTYLYSGYGMFRLDGKLQSAHRASWKLHFGIIPKGISVLHKCDNPLCLNPNHLWLGTQADNVMDKMKKGRQRNADGPSLLTDNQIREIRSKVANGETKPSVAKQYGRSRKSIYNIATYRSYKWVD